MVGLAMLWEKPLTVVELSRKTGYKRDYIRSACYRARWNNPLPHVKSGIKRPVIYIRESEFQRWLEREEARCCR